MATEVTDAVLRAQLHLARCSVWFMSGDASLAVAEADTVLASPGLPERIYAAAAQSRLLALITQDDPGISADQLTPSGDDAGTPAALTTLAALAWRASGGRHDFTSISGIQAQRLDLVVDEHYADDAVARRDVADTNPSEVHHELKGA